jgi:hypothetical protein
MDNFDKELPLISFVGGIDEGKSTLIQALWKERCVEGVVTEEIPGRGIFQYRVKESSPIISSLSDLWLSNNENIDLIKETDTLLYLLPSQTFGYDEEFYVLRQIKEINPQINIILVCTKIDLLFNEITKQSDAIEDLLRIERIIMNSHSIYNATCLLDDIVMVSADKKWNLETLRERIWNSLIEKINNTIFDEKIPTLVISGKRGCGKSSTLNKLFGLDLPINMATACTKYPRVMHVEVAEGSNLLHFNVVDLPGIAESIDADIVYASYYEKYIERATALLCLSQAGTRAYLQDQLFYSNLIERNIINEKTNILLGINQVDLLYKTMDQPDGVELCKLQDTDKILHDKIKDFYDIYQKLFVGIKNISMDNIIAFSTIQNWNIDLLKTKIINLLNV